jgi:hypothetical protein
MKNIKFLTLLTLLTTVFFGCDSVEDAIADLIPSFDITENFVLEVPVSVVANANGNCVDYSESTTFDVRSNSDINENWSLIEDVQINSISWELTNYVGDDGVFISSGMLKVGETSFEVGEVDLKSVDLQNEIFIITDASKLSAIGNQIRSGGSVTVILEVSSGGNCENDHSYTLKFTANVSVTVQPS